MEVIRAENLSFSYGEIPVLRSASFSVQSGEFVELIGSNGAGKSTLFRLVLGLLPPSGGSVRLFGADPRTGSRSRAGYVPQSAARTGGFPATAAEAVVSGLAHEVGLFRLPKREHRKRAMEALRTVGMEAFSGRLLGSLSGGQRQRVMLARVLAAEPELLLLDEPTAGVDEEGARSFYDLLRRLNRERGITVVMATHDVERAARYASCVLRLSGGRIRRLDERGTGHV